MKVVRQRLARQYLLGTSFRSGREVVKSLGAVQAQDFAGAKWALGMRTSSATDTDIEREFTDGSIIRTHVLRPTWHFVDPADLRWMLALTAPRVKQAMASYNRKLELDAPIFRRSHTAIAKALQGGRFLTRAELRAVLSRARLGAITPQRMGHLMMEAELDAVICSGPRRGRHFTYALVDERVPATAPIDRDDALSRLTWCYFRTRGPATAHDYSWWSGLSMADVRRGISIAAPDLEAVSMRGAPHWIAGDVRPSRRASAHLLPNYDEYFIGHRDRSAIGQRLRSVESVTGGNALIAHVIVVDGQLVGGWRLLREGPSAVVKLHVLDRLSAPERKRMLAEIERLATFLGVPVTLRKLG
jgi:hypothetical protein